MGQATGNNPDGPRRRWRTLLVALAVGLPVPVLAATGLAVPLPNVVERIAASLVAATQSVAFGVDDAPPLELAETIHLTDDEAEEIRKSASRGVGEAAGGGETTLSFHPPSWQEDVTATGDGEGRTKVVRAQEKPEEVPGAEAGDVTETAAPAPEPTDSNGSGEGGTIGNGGGGADNHQESGGSGSSGSGSTDPGSAGSDDDQPSDSGQGSDPPEDEGGPPGGGPAGEGPPGGGPAGEGPPGGGPAGEGPPGGGPAGEGPPGEGAPGGGPAGEGPPGGDPPGGGAGNGKQGEPRA